MSRFDTVICDGHALLPGGPPTRCDIGIRDGRIATIADRISAADCEERVSAAGKVVFPGAVDAHFHIGIYRPIEEDASSETESSLVGGATTILSYFRTGQHYLNRTGPYSEVLPDLIAATQGRAHTDFSYHLAPITAGHRKEIGALVTDAGIASFKFYMHFMGLDTAGDSDDVAKHLMTTEDYDLGHLFAIMEEVAAAGVGAGPEARVSLSVHCENPQLIKLFMARVRERAMPPLQAYSEGRPPLSERLAIHEAGVLADATSVSINLLHLSSKEALRGANDVRRLYPNLDLRAETTLHHLCLTYQGLEGKGLGGKVNPPIRQQQDVDALWAGVQSGAIAWVASDHACCMESMKGDDLWPALPGFGGTALLYPVLISEGYHRRGIPLERIAGLASANPARAYACHPRKGSISIGADADLAIIDLEKEQVVTPDLLHSHQDHTPFQGFRVKGWPVMTMLRGRIVYRDGKVTAPACGQFLARPTPLGSS